MKAQRLSPEPIIHRGLDASLGDNINGPSLIRVPEWVSRPLARYYLCFAHHQGRCIRLAYADDLAGPWQVYRPGVLPLEDSGCFVHVASPDVHVDHARRQIGMYFHGVAFAAGQPTDGLERRFDPASRWIGNQRTKLALSSGGLHFTARPEPLGASYFRVFEWRGRLHALAMPGAFYCQAEDGSGFEPGPILFDASFRHGAVHVDGQVLQVFFTRVGDAPERILHTRIDLAPDWRMWSTGKITPVLQPELEWAGAALPVTPSQRGPLFTAAHQLRDPAVFVEGERRYLLYSAAAEHAIGLAELTGT